MRAAWQKQLLDTAPSSGSARSAQGLKIAPSKAPSLKQARNFVYPGGNGSVDESASYFNTTRGNAAEGAELECSLDGQTVSVSCVGINSRRPTFSNDFSPFTKDLAVWSIIR